MPNPVLNDKTFEKAEAEAGWAAPGAEPRTAAAPVGPITDGPSSPYVAYQPEGGVMTRAGAYTATGVLLAILFIGAFVGWFTVSESPAGDVTSFPSWLLLPLFGAVGARLRRRLQAEAGPLHRPDLRRRSTASCSVPSPTSTTASGTASCSRPSASPPPSPLMMYTIYALRIIKVTDKFRKTVIGATIGVAVFYGISLLLSLFGVTVSYFSSASLWSIVLSIVIAGVAAFNLMLDFDLVDRGAESGAPKYMEWYAAFGLLVTLVWLYLEILRLLSKIQSRLAAPSLDGPGRRPHRCLRTVRSARLIGRPRRAATVPRSFGRTTQASRRPCGRSRLRREGGDHHRRRWRARA